MRFATQPQTISRHETWHVICYAHLPVDDVLPPNYYCAVLCTHDWSTCSIHLVLVVAAAADNDDVFASCRGRVVDYRILSFELCNSPAGLGGVYSNILHIFMVLCEFAECTFRVHAVMYEFIVLRSICTFCLLPCGPFVRPLWLLFVSTFLGAPHAQFRFVCQSHGRRDVIRAPSFRWDKPILLIFDKVRLPASCRRSFVHRIALCVCLESWLCVRTWHAYVHVHILSY